LGGEILDRKFRRAGDYFRPDRVIRSVLPAGPAERRTLLFDELQLLCLRFGPGNAQGRIVPPPSVACEPPRSDQTHPVSVRGRPKDSAISAVVRRSVTSFLTSLVCERAPS